MLKKIKSLSYSPFIGALLILLLVVIPDLIVRRSEMQLWNGSYIGFYLISVLMGYSGYYLVCRIVSSIKKSSVSNLICIAASIFLAMSIIGSFGYRTYFGNIPTIFTFQLMILEPQEALISAQNEFSFLRIILIALLISLFWMLFKKSCKPTVKYAKTKLISSLILFVGTWAILNNQVRFVDQCFTLDTNILITTGKLAHNSLSSRQFNRTGMHAGNRPKFTSSGIQPGFNILVIVNESVRAKDFPLNDTTKTQMPELLNRYKANPADYFIFPNAYGTATTTMVAYPTTISGANSQTEVLAMHKLPLLWNYADKFDCDKYLISSHVYYWRNFVSFVTDKSLNKLWYQEISGQQSLTGFFGNDDKHALDTLLANLDVSIGKKRNFMAVLHTYDQHYPYFYPEKEGDSHTYDDYMRSQGYLDRILAKAEKYLEDKGIADNTIILFTSDHGEAFGEHGQFSHVGIDHIEAANISFFVKIPQKLQQKYNISTLRENQDKVISNTDIAPTIIDLYNLRQDKEVSSVIPQLPGFSLFEPISQDRKVVVSSNTEYAVMRDEHGVGIYGKDESLVFNFIGGQPKFEFYDLKKDPDQTKNIWSTTTDSVKLEYEQIFLNNINLKRTYDLVIKKSFTNFK